MVASLLLLFLFLANWVQRAYEDEKESLRKEISYSVKDVIRGIEDSLFQKVMLTNVKLERRTNDIDLRRTRSEQTPVKDSVHVIVKKQTIHSDENLSDSTVKMVFQHRTDSIMEPGNVGLLSFLLRWETESDSILEYDVHSEVNVVDLINADFRKLIADRDLPRGYKIIEKEAERGGREIEVEFYRDVREGRVFTAQFQQANTFVLKKIWQQIAFALLLFGAVSASFYIIYTNWRRQQRLIDIKNDFISNVSHELKTPISTVSVALEALSDFDVIQDRVRTREYLQISQNEINRLRMLVDKVLKMSIFEKGAVKMQIETVTLDKLVEEVMHNMQVQFEKERVTLHLVKRGDQFDIEADRIHLTNVVYNLLDNAVKYCIEKPELLLTVDGTGPDMIFSVKDNGIGISEEYRDKVFDRFFRVPRGDRHDVQGHGLGLSYVSTVLKRLGAEIELTSQPGKGSLFLIKLKRKYVGS